MFEAKRPISSSSRGKKKWHHLFFSSGIFLLFISLPKTGAIEFLQKEWTNNIRMVQYVGPKYVQIGDTLNITCEMSRFYAPKWTRNNKPIDYQKDSRIRFELNEGFENNRLETIIVENVKRSDQGFYRCNSFSRKAHFVHVVISGSKQESFTAQSLIVDELSSSKENLKFQMLENENSIVQLNCNLKKNKPDVRVVWLKQGVPIEFDERRYSKGSQLIILNATSEGDADQYACYLDRDANHAYQWPKSDSFSQVVELRAPIRVRPLSTSTKIIHKIQGESLDLTCSYSGFPKGQIQWIIGNQFLNRKQLEWRGIILDTMEQPNDFLRIRNLKTNHSNTYTCLVDNGYKTAFSKDEQSVMVKVRENSILISGPHVLIENRELRISCNISQASNEDFLHPKWFRDSIDLSELQEYGEHIRVEEVSPKQWDLVIKRAKLSDVGNYSCVHNNQNATIKVRSKPMLYPFDEFQATNYQSANIVEGERLTLRCALADGYDRDAQLEWFKYNEDDAVAVSEASQVDPFNTAELLLTINMSDPRISIEFNDSIKASVLTIDPVQPKDRFFYVCKSHNDVTTFNNTILLRVKDKYAALWPFLGIVAEVFILCIIIFVYEKRKVKPDFDDAEDNHHLHPHKGEGKKTSQDRASRSQDAVRQQPLNKYHMEHQHKSPI